MKTNRIFDFDFKVFPYIIVLLIAYLVLPLISGDTGSAMFNILFVLPLLNVILGLIYSYKNRVSIYYYILNFIALLPTITFIFKQWDTLIYALIYFLAAVFGTFIGIGLKKYNSK